MLDIQKMVNEAVQDPVVAASALIISLIKPYIAQQLGLSSAEQPQALPQHIPQPSFQQSPHDYPQQTQQPPQHTQTPHTIQIPQAPPEKK